MKKKGQWGLKSRNAFKQKEGSWEKKQFDPPRGFNEEIAKKPFTGLIPSHGGRNLTPPGVKSGERKRTRKGSLSAY